MKLYDHRYIKTKIRTYQDKVYTNFRCLNVPEDDIECESFTVTFIDSLLVYDEKYYLQVFLNNLPYISYPIYYLDENLFEDYLL